MRPTLHLTDLPRSVSLSLYDETREEVRKRYRNTRGVIEVLEFGLIPCPGISDLDFYVIVEPGATVEFPRLSTYTPDQKWAMMHKHFATSDNVWRDIRLFDPWLMQIPPLLDPNGPRNIEGVRELSEEERHVVSYENIMSGELFMDLKTIGEITATGKVHCRNWLDTVKSTTYCHRELKRAGATDVETLPFSESYSALRDEWFEIPEADLQTRVEHDVEDYKKAVSSLLRTLAPALENAARGRLKLSLPPRTPRIQKLLKQYPRSLIVDINESTLIYQEGRTDNECIYKHWKSPISSTEYGHGTYVLPLSLCATQNIHLTTEGILSDHYRNCCATDLEELPVLDHPVLRKRSDVLNTNLRDTLKVTGAKQPFRSFGADAQGKSLSGLLRARLGGYYDQLMERAPFSPLHFVVPHREVRVVL